MWQRHNAQLVNFDVTSFACYLGPLSTAASNLEKGFSGCENSVGEKEWRDPRTHRVIGPKAAAAAFSHVVRDGAAGSRVVRATSSTAVSSNTRRTREWQF